MLVTGSTPALKWRSRDISCHDYGLLPSAMIVSALTATLIFKRTPSSAATRMDLLDIQSVEGRGVQNNILRTHDSFSIPSIAVLDRTEEISLRVYKIESSVWPAL
jgi:hypothetical protein